MSTPKVSIIVPVYKAMPYLENCLSSLLAQTIIDKIEIICIDDCGGDDSINYIKNLQETHVVGCQIKLSSMSHNSGAWAARNEGLKQAVGEYVGFVDADDWCEPNMFELLYNKAVEFNADWCYGNAVKHLPAGKTKSLRQTHPISGEFGANARKEILSSHIALFWSGIYRREHLSKYDIKFPAFKFSEDSYFIWMVVSTAKNIASVDKNLYHYLVHSNSVSKRPDPTKAMQKVEIFNMLKQNLINLGFYKDFSEEIDYLCLKKGYIIPMLIEAINNKKEYKKAIAEILNKLSVNMTDYTENAYYKADYKCKILMCFFKRMPGVIASILRLRYKQDNF